MTRGSQRRWHSGIALGFAVGLAACTGIIGDGGEFDRDQAAAGPPPSGASDAGASSDAAATGTMNTVLRRLTRKEYENTVRDLLGEKSSLTELLPVDVEFNGFDNNAEISKADELAIDKYDAVAETVVANALSAQNPLRSKLVTCDVASGGASCVRTIVSAFARRAWRRPVAADEIDRLMTALDDASMQGQDVQTGLALALRTALVSPHFLYRVEVDPADAKGAHDVSAHELAARLSYFLWSSTPDDTLLAHADDGSLSKPDVFAAEVDRHLKDAKADALVDNFAAQWLNTRAVADNTRVAPDPKTFPEFDDDLRSAMVAEPLMFFRSFLNGNSDIRGMIDADFTFANERLAKHYGIGGVSGAEMRQVPVLGTKRFGILSQGSMLTQTSMVTRGSPTRRGKWVLTRLLCSPPPDPPPNTPPLPQDPGSSGLPPDATIRQRMEAHRKNPACAGCHAVMDPIGFGLEHYDGVGAWRDAYSNAPIDATGQLPGGLQFDGAQELAGILKKDPRFLDCFAQNVFSYAFGRQPSTPDDQVALAAIAKQFADGGGRLRDLLSIVTKSNAFHLRGGVQP